MDERLVEITFVALILLVLSPLVVIVVRAILENDQGDDAISNTIDVSSDVGVIWIGSKSHRMPCVVYKDDNYQQGRLGLSCDWSRCGDGNQCLYRLPDFGSVFGEGDQ